MKIRQDVLRISSNAMTEDGRIATPEQQVVQRVISGAAPTTTTLGDPVATASQAGIATSIVAEMGQAGDVASSFRWRCGNCVAEGTLVLTEDGPRPIEHSLAMRSTYVRGAWRTVPAGQATGVKEVVKVTTTHGAELVVTPDHRFWTNRGWVAAVDLRSAFRPGGAADNRDEIERLFGVELARRDLIARPTAELLGALAGDGWVATRHRELYGVGFGFCDEMREAFAPLLKYAAELFGSREQLRRRSSSGGGDLVSPSGQPFNTIEWRTEAACHFATEISKTQIPRAVWSSTMECQAAFLRGLFTTDGSVSVARRPRVTFYQTSKSLVDEVRLMLSVLGIHSTLHCEVRAPRYKDLWSVSIARQASVRRFAELIGFLDSRRQLALAGLAIESRPSPERVRSVEPAGLAYVYDLSVPATESFYANGVLVHNCKHYDNKGFIEWMRHADHPLAPADHRAAVNEIRSGLLMTQNAQVQEMHTGQDGDMDVEAALQMCGWCHALSKLCQDNVGVHAFATCPATARDLAGNEVAVITPTQQMGFYQPRDRAAQKAGSSMYDKVLRIAEGKEHS